MSNKMHRSEKEKELQDPPDEQISSVKFLPPIGGEESLLAATSWDGSLRLYDFKQNKLIFNKKFGDEGMPILSLAATVSHFLIDSIITAFIREFL